MWQKLFLGHFEHTSADSTIQQWLAFRIAKGQGSCAAVCTSKIWWKPVVWRMAKLSCFCIPGQSLYEADALVGLSVSKRCKHWGLCLKHTDSWLVDKTGFYWWYNNWKSLLRRTEHTSLSKCSGTKCVTTDSHRNRHSCFYPGLIWFVSRSRESSQ